MPKTKFHAKTWKNFSTVLRHAEEQAKYLRTQFDDMKAWSNDPACKLHKSSLDFVEGILKAIESDIYLLPDCSENIQCELLVKILSTLSTTSMRINILWIAGNPILYKAKVI